MAPHATLPDSPLQFNDGDVPATHSESFKIIIIGAGIAGLSAAIGLRRAGHKVEVFERSSFANETGAAIHVCPNASRVLLDWGLDPVKREFDETKSILTANAQSLKPIFQGNCDHIRPTYRTPWYLAHRVDLHSSLKDLAFSPAGDGPPAKLHLRSKVVAIDDKSARIVLEDGSSHQADLIVAADGVHSSAVKQVLGVSNEAEPTGASAFRFLIPTEDILADERTRHFIEGKDGGMKIFVGEGGRRLVWYPCRAGKVQNFVGIHPDNEHFAAKEEWNVSAKPSDLLEEYQSFHPDLIATINKATDIKLWKLLYRAPISSWHHNRLLLIGDAAHPMLPHQGQGGAQSIEDGAALGILFSKFSPSSASSPSFEADISARLQAFEDVRRKRATLMQIFSNVGQDESAKVKGEVERLFGQGVEVPSNPIEFQAFNFGHDVRVESRKILEGLEGVTKQEQRAKGSEVQNAEELALPNGGASEEVGAFTDLGSKEIGVGA